MGAAVAKKTEKWKEFEQLVAKIYAEATPEATVRHNYFIEGRSGRRRQIDVSIESRQGLHNYLTVVECKRYSRRVGILDVEAYNTKLHDVRANKGVMVSITGFDEGAQAQARQHDITLFSYRESKDTDWHGISAATWLTFVAEEFRVETMRARLADGGRVLVPAHEFLCTTDQECFSARELAGSVIWNHPALAPTPEAMRERYPGPMSLDAAITTTAGPLFFSLCGKPRQVERLAVHGTFIARRYAVNPTFAAGNVFEDALTGELRYAEMSSLPFNLEAIVRSQEGQELTKDEYLNPLGLRVLLPPETVAESGKLRITITAP